MGIFSNDNGKKLKGGNSEIVASISESTNKVNGVSLISMETTIKGTIETTSMFQLEGVLEGDIKGDTLVHIGPTGKVTGNITAKEVLVDGEVSGEITAHKVEIGREGKVFATITSATFVIQEGGVFEGSKKMKIALIKEEVKRPKSDPPKVESPKPEAEKK